MRGIITAAGYVPHHRLERAAIAAAHGGGAAKGSRSVASYDEDSTTMGVEAARLALRSSATAPSAVDQLWFSTTSPAYTDKTNATVVHAALRLDRDTPVFDANGSVRSAAGALRAALTGTGTTLVVTADQRTGLPNSADERDGGDAGAAVLVGDGSDGSYGGGAVIAEYLGGASTSEEFLDRWRVPGEPRSRQWEERFGEMRYVPLGSEAFALALDATGIAADDIASVVVTGTHGRAVRQLGGKVGTGTGGVADNLALTVGNTGAAHPLLQLTAALETAEAGQVIVLVVLSDGCDVFVFRATDAISSWQPRRTVARQIETGDASLPYLKFLAWNDMVAIQPPNRPEPARASSSAAVRNEDWKFGFVGSRDRSSGAVHLPPARVSYDGGQVDDMDALPMADVEGTVATFTVDRLAYSPSPPIVFAVVDFDGGGRLPVELTDVAADDVTIGGRVQMSFRRLNQSDGIQNYFWKAKPVR